MALKKIKLPNNTTVDINDARNVVIGDGADNIVTLTNAEYQALTTKDPNTVYIVTDVDPGGGGGGGDGTVTSVAMTVPTGLSVSGSPITTSGTLAVSLASGYSIPTTTKQSEWDGKADKVSSATNGNFASLDSNGNLADSGHKHSDYLTSETPLSKGTTTGNGNAVTDLSVSGHTITLTKGTTFLTSHQDISGKADKVSSATNRDFAGLDSNGNLTDSGKKDSDFVHTTGNETIAGNKTFTGTTQVEEVYNDTISGFGWLIDCDSDSVQDALDAKQATLVSGTNIKTINNESILGSGNITVGGGGDTSSCVHKTGDETVGGDKTFTDNIGVVDADHIVYSGGGGGGGFTRGYAVNDQGNPSQTMTFTGLLGEPKAFIIAYGVAGDMDSNGVNFVAGDSTGLHGVYNTGTQHNYSASFTKSYSSGTLTITAPSGVVFGDYAYSLVYYYGDGTLTFKTSTIQPGSGVTAVTFTGTDLTEVPAMYAVMLETQVNDEQYRRVAGYTNSAYSGSAVSAEGITFLTGGPIITTSSFTASYNNGLYINSGGTNAGGYFHNPGTYTLYYLMASDVAGGGGGGFQSLGDELDDIRDTIGDIATILASI